MPSLIVVGGPNGAGKSTFIREFISRENYLYLCADEAAFALCPRSAGNRCRRSWQIVSQANCRSTGFRERCNHREHAVRKEFCSASGEISGGGVLGRSHFHHSIRSCCFSCKGFPQGKNGRSLRSRKGHSPEVPASPQEFLESLPPSVFTRMVRFCERLWTRAHPRCDRFQRKARYPSPEPV